MLNAVDIGQNTSNASPRLPITTIPTDVLEYIAAYLHYHERHPWFETYYDSEEAFSHARPSDDMLTWDEAFIEISYDVLIELTLAAHYLDIPSLVDLCARRVANAVIGKTTQQVWDMFGVWPETDANVYLD